MVENLKNLGGARLLRHLV